MRPMLYPSTLRAFVTVRSFGVAGDFCFISLMGRATYLWAEDRYELHILKYKKPRRKHDSQMA